MNELKDAFDRIDRQQTVTDQRIAELNKRMDDSFVPRTEATIIATTLEKRLDVIESQFRKVFWALVTLVATVIGGAVSVFLGG